jgi:DHA2 family multidrug resistance protein-like MFS transporter
LLSVASWRALFVLPAVFALITLLFGIRHLPQSQSGTHRPDVQGATLIALSFGPLVAGISLLSLRYSLPTALLLTATGLVIGIVLLRHQRARPVPMLPLDLLRNPATGLAVATSFTSHAAQQVAQIALPFILLNSLHYSAKVTGMLLAIWPAAMLATTPLSGHLADRLSAARMGVAGLTMAAFGFAALAYADADNFWWMGTALALVGAGVSVFQTPNNRLIVASAPLHRRGMVGGVLSTTRITGHSLGAAGAAYLVQFPAHPMLPLATACALAIAAATLSAIRPR